MDNSADAIVARLQRMYPWKVQQVGKTGEPEDWFTVPPDKIVQELVIKEANLLAEVQVISAQIMYYGRLTAQCKRIWEIRERKYRVWRDGQALALIDPTGKPKAWKKPTQAQVDQTIRTTPKYEVHYAAIEAAEEAYNATNAVLDGFRAKRDMMKAAIIRRNENSAPILCV